MKRLSALLMVPLLPACALWPAPQKPAAQLPFPPHFATRDAIIQWAEHSTFGGGRWEDVNFGGNRLLVAMRTPTSGVPSSDIAIYKETPLGWRLAGGHETVFNDFIVLDRTPRGLVFRTQAGRDEILRLSRIP